MAGGPHAEDWSNRADHARAQVNPTTFSVVDNDGGRRLEAEKLPCGPRSAGPPRGSRPRPRHSRRRRRASSDQGAMQEQDRDQHGDEQVAHEDRLDDRQCAEMQSMEKVPGDVDGDRGEPQGPAAEIDQQPGESAPRSGTSFVLRCSMTEDNPNRIVAASVSATTRIGPPQHGARLADHRHEAFEGPAASVSEGTRSPAAGTRTFAPAPLPYSATIRSATSSS